MSKTMPCRLFSFILFVLFGGCWSCALAGTSAEPARDRIVAEEFTDPPLSARPGAFWPWLNGDVDLERITYELEQMKDKGMAGADIWDVRALRDPSHTIPAGPAFLSDGSLRAIRHAVTEAGRLGLRLGMVAASGWNAGGTWVKPGDAGLGLFHAEVELEGPAEVTQLLPFPKVPKQCPKEASGRPVYYREVAVLAVPAAEDRSIATAGSVLDLSDHLDAEGRLSWHIPEGKWTVFRYIVTNTGYSLIVPSPNSQGPMIDFLNPDATRMHFQYIVDRLQSVLGPLSETALKYLEVDSMELGEDLPWTGRLREAFLQQHHYDPLPYLPVLTGWKVVNKDISERFLYDWGKTISDVFIESHYRTGAELLNRAGVELCAEAGGPGPPIWDSCPVDALKALGAVNLLRGEFWPKQRNMRVVKEVSSAAHIYGKRLVDAESFTSWRHWQDGPYFLKQLADNALGEGLNHFTFHTFTHSPAAAGLPGRAYHAGTHINPNVVWWPMARPFMDYLSRCCYLLQQGLFVADVCYYYGDKAPNFLSPKHIGFSPGAGYDYDATDTEVLLTRMSVRNGRIVLPDGMSYAVLVLPEQRDMDLDVLKKLGSLVRAGATVIGPKPTRTGTLADYPQRDRQVAQFADELWGPCDGKGVRETACGEGRIIWNRSVSDVLREQGIPQDFCYEGADGRTRLDYVHRRVAETDLYLVVNRNERWEDVQCLFRMEGKQAELWDPETGDMAPIPAYETAQGRTRLSLHLQPAESVFIVFRAPAHRAHFTRLERVGGPVRTSTPALLSHSATPGGPAWLSDGETPVAGQEITFDLGRTHHVQKIRLWNYNENVLGYCNYGIKEMEVLVSADGTAYRPAGAFALHAATTEEDKHYQEDLPLDVENVRYLRFQVKSNQNNSWYSDGVSRYVGLSKVQFFGPEEITGVTMRSVSSGRAFDPASDGDLGQLHPGAELQPGPGGAVALKVWAPGTYVLHDTSGSQRFEMGTTPPPVEVTGPWQVSFPPGWGAPAQRTWDRLISWTQADEDGIKYFSGRATYRTTFTVPQAALGPHRCLELDLGVVREVARVTLNGRPLGILWKPPFTLDITEAVSPGTNELVVEVANTWTNRLIGDAFAPDGKGYCRTNLHEALSRKDRRLQPSGLMGPVRINHAELVPVRPLD